MIIALVTIKYLSELTDRLFEARMQRAAIKIRIHSQRFPR
jgi:hypothetical protein